MNTKKTAIFFLIALSLFSACDTRGPEPDWNSGRDGKAAVRVRIRIGAAGVQGRTVRPNAALEDVAVWELRGVKQGGEETLLAEFSNAEGETVAIDPGTWNFTLTGYKNSALILSGSITGQTVSLAGTNILDFTVAPVLEGEGAVNIIIELPPGSGITEARVFQDGAELESPITPAGNQIVFAKTCAAGAYYFSVRLYKDGALYGAVSEAVYVWANLTSEKTYTLTLEDLKITYVITYHIGDGETETGYYRRTDASLTLADPPSRQGFFFRGWYESADFSGGAVAVIPSGSVGDKDFHAKWLPAEAAPSDYSLAESLAWIRANAVEGGAYAITLNADESVAPADLSYEGKKVDVILSGGAAERTISLSSSGSLFTVGNGVTLTLGSDVVLQGLSGNTASLVKVNNGGTLAMNAGSKISGNAAAPYGGGVYVNGGAFVMNGGEISGCNASSYGGGVYVSGGAFTMSGGEISGCNASSYGGGVYVSSGASFAMNGGEISGNAASAGGGVYVSSGGAFAKQSGGAIYGSNAAYDELKNIAADGDNYGHAVYVDGSPAKIRNGAAGEGVTLDSSSSGSAGGWETPIPNNYSLAQSLDWLGANAEEGGSYTIVLSSANETLAPQMLSYRGKNVAITLKGDAAERTVSLNANGALFIVENGVTLTLGDNIVLRGRSGNTSALVRVNNGGALEMNSGSKIAGNVNTTTNGGGVTVNSGGAFAMNGGEISGCAVSAGYGGGVYVNGGAFVKGLGGAIYGSNASDALKNTAQSDDYGHAVYVSADKKCNSTVGEGVALDSSASGAAGGWVEWTVTFVADGGSPATQIKTVNSGGFLGSAMPSEPTWDGYIFGGWYTAQNGGGSEFAADTPVTDDITVYAKWGQYTATFDADGGSFAGGSATQTRVANYGDSLGDAMPSAPAKSHYVFEGWYTEQNGGGSEFAADTPVTGNITLFAKWTAVQYTVTYDANGGSGTAPSARTEPYGTEITLADGSGLIKDGYTFYGWNSSASGDGASYAAGDSFTVASHITLFAMWSGVPPGLSLAESLAWISANAVEGGAYTITVNADESLAPRTLSYSGKTVSVTLEGGSAERTVSLSSSGALFTVESGVTLALGNNVALQGRSGNTNSVVVVNSGGTLEINAGSKISGNVNSSSSFGGGVYVYGGTLAMNGGTISGNTSSYGGGVCVYGGTLAMNGGTISDNTSSSYGGGVFIYSGGAFTMSDGAISDNTSSSSGGGVNVYNGTFTMSGGTISGNTANSSSYGGGVYVYSGGTFTKQSGGTIYGSDASADLKNTAYSDTYGHAVYVSSAKKRNTTVGAGVTLNSSLSGEAGGWIDPMPGNLSLADSLAWISANAVEGDAYTITVNASESLAPQTLSYSGKTVGVTLEGGSAERTVSLSSSGSLFTVGSGVTLALGDNITLQGRSGNTNSVVVVNSGGALEMNSGSKISGNANSSSSGGGVYVSGGALAMNGGEISGNTSTSNAGGGVYVYSNGTFTMSGGTVGGNTAGATGGGVYVSSGSTFTMTGGTINGNTAYHSSYGGGGVFVSSGGAFTMSGGTISGNTASNYGGGVGVDSNGTFTKQSGGVIYGSDASADLKNTAYSDTYGHAVYVSSAKKRNTTVGAGVTLDSSLSGEAGGWIDPMPGNLSLADSLAWISANAVEGGAYTITVNANESLAPQTLSYSGKTVGVTLEGGSAERTVSLGSSGSLFTVESGVTLKLGSNITLQGRSGNTSALVQVNTGTTLEMNPVSKISGNTASATSLYGNSYSGGGVYVSSGASFAMNGGTISGNTATATASGGGVYVSGGAFTMSGGEISGNKASDGGGVCVSGSGAFTKETGGVIYGSDASTALKNTANRGQAVYVNSSPAKKRDSTAGEGVTLNSGTSGSAGGWE